MRIGVDVGGTNTDAVLMDGSAIRAVAKTVTTTCIGNGIRTAVTEVLRLAEAPPPQVRFIAVGTTHLVNALIERRHLGPVGIVRICLPTGAAVPPLSGWPADLVDSIRASVHMVRGGYQFDGSPLAPLDETAIVAAAKKFRRLGIKRVAISCVFSPVKPDMEERAAAIVLDQIPDASVTLSGRLGHLGLLERENAAVLNASLVELAADFYSSLQSSLRQTGIQAPIYIVQNNGTLLDVQRAKRNPVLTFASGPTNSIRGAGYLSGVADAIVVDVGGTTTDIGALAKGFPRESSGIQRIAGVRTNFRMPDVVTIGIGGGSVVSHNDSGGEVAVGPLSVGARLSQESLVFGGDRVTATDIAVAAELACIGEPRNVRNLPAQLVTAALRCIHNAVEDAIDSIRAGPDVLPIVIVGGGSILLRTERSAVPQAIVPEHAAVANAVGAALGDVSGEAEMVVDYRVRRREEAIAEAIASARARAEELGANDSDVRVLEVLEVPLAYLPGETVRLRVRAVGPIPAASSRPAVTENPTP